jgi:hypothetical protein
LRSDPELARLVDAWPNLDERIRAVISALVGVRSQDGSDA